MWEGVWEGGGVWGTLGGVEGVLGKVRWEDFYGGRRGVPGKRASAI